MQRGDAAIIILLLILSASLDPKNLQKTSVGGANEILDKPAAPDEILGAIRRIRAGG